MYAQAQPVGFTAEKTTSDIRKPGPVESEVSKASEYMERLHHALSALDDRLQLVFQAVPQQVGGAAPKEAASCELHERLQRCTESIDSAIARVNSMAARIQL